MSNGKLTGLALVAALALPGTVAQAGNDYPPPKRPPGAQKPPDGPFRTIKVCKRGCRYRAIQAGVNAARAGDTVKVGRGTYREGVRIIGSAKRYLRLIGDAKRPARVLLDGRGLPASRAQNGVLINGADQVTVNGFKATRFRGNGFFVTSAVGYRLTNLNAALTGVYGVYVFNSKGGEISNSEASFNNDAGFYIGQTPPQSRPLRSIVRGVKSYANVIGFSGTNMRYVTITKSQWFNNGVGIVPNALDSEKFAPPEDNVITDNDVFWNNFNYYAGAPFPLQREAAGTPYPIGTGILLFGGRRHVITNNRVYGNYLVGVGAVEQLLLKQADAQDLVGNRVRDNSFGAGGADLNGRDLFYDGNGTDNCWGPNDGVAVTVPASGSTMSPCPFEGANAFDAAAQGEALNWAVGDPTHEAFWIKHPHAAKAGITPLERFTP